LVSGEDVADAVDAARAGLFIGRFGRKLALFGLDPAGSRLDPRRRRAFRDSRRFENRRFIFGLVLTDGFGPSRELVRRGGNLERARLF
jgi:hypothetical protein